MRSILSQSHHRAQRGAANSHSSSAHYTHLCAMSPVTFISITTAALLILTAPPCESAPVAVAEVTTDQRQLLSQINAVCSYYLSTEDKFWASDPLGELCVLMLIQKSKELKTQESKRAELQGPGGIQSRGYFLYRPRNGRRSLEYE
ncbi:neuromedin-U [Periophthalmus magnuspinnatus]|uniref:neuromedin-U n=1 Tax=Periophthalmus magnuspinnatus TaxID=409849 RepID=UPI00145C14E8|nr:neuromedin-U [Periophthalmus magnuspinnatus]